MIDFNFIGNDHFQLETVESTNSYCKKLIKSGSIENGTIVSTNNQTLGKGQRENSWESEKGKNIIMSFVYIPDSITAENQFVISKAVCLSISDMLSEYTKDTKIKWPNDIYLNDNKVAGILIENSLRGNKISNSVIGIGLNINQLKFSQNIPNPTSLAINTNKKYTIEEIFNKLIDCLNARFSSLLLNDLKKINTDYLSNLYRINEIHNFEAENIQFKAIIRAIDSFGNLVLELENGDSQVFGFKEVKFL